MQVTIDHRNIPALLNKLTKMVSEFPAGALRISAMGISLDTSKVQGREFTPADRLCRRHSAVLVSTVRDALVRPTPDMSEGQQFKRACTWEVIAAPVTDIWAEKPFGLRWFQFPGKEVGRRGPDGKNIMSTPRAIQFLEASCIDGVCGGANWVELHDGLTDLSKWIGTNQSQRLAGLAPEERVLLHRLEEALAGKPVPTRHVQRQVTAPAAPKAEPVKHEGPAPLGKTEKKKIKMAAAAAAKRAADAEAAKQGKAAPEKGKPAKQGKGKGKGK